MVVQTREWTETAGDDLAGRAGRVLWIEDGTLGHSTDVGPGDTVEVLLTDYVAGYDAGDDLMEVTVRWRLYQDGVETDCGSHTWESR